MATINWNAGMTGDWSDPGNWASTAEVPDEDDTAVISGSHSNVTVSTAIVVDEIIFKANNSTFTEDAAASISVNVLQVSNHATVFLNAVNTVGETDLGADSLVDLGVSGALGTETIFDSSGTIEANASTIALRNPLDIQDVGSLSAAHGDRLAVLGHISASSATPTVGPEFIFGSVLDPSGHDGTVVLASRHYTTDSPDPTSIFIQSGTVTSGTDDQAFAANTIFSAANWVEIDAGATLDVGNFGTDVTLETLNGSGTLIDNHDRTLIHIDGTVFSGTLSGKTQFAVTGGNQFTGALGSTVFTMGADTDVLDLTQATGGSFTVFAPAGADATVEVGALTTNKFGDFQDGNLTIDVSVAPSAGITYVQGSDYLKAVIHPGGGQAAFALFFLGMSSPDGIQAGSADDGDMQLTYVAPGEIAHHVAEAAFVPLPHDTF